MKKHLLILFFLAVSSSSIIAQSYTEIVWEQIQNAYEENADEGYSVKNYIIGTISEDDDNIWTFYFSSSKEYLIEGFCDEDCDDLDLYLLDSDGDQLDSDTEEDDYPIIYFEPDASSTYSIKVSMYSCEVEPCYFGLAIFES
tara:strand:- start:48206 stop:48631 length:426 start_codon:yes stop_codon:yes gene_type:complete